MSTYFESLARMIRELQSREDVEVEYAELDPGRDDVESLARETGLTIAAPILRLYREMDGLRLSWTSTTTDEGGAPSLSGNIEILSFEQTFGIGHSASYAAELLGISFFSEEEQLAMRDFHLFDYVRSDDQDGVGWLSQGAQVHDALAPYWAEQRGHGPALWNTDAYLAELLRTRGALVGERGDALHDEAAVKSFFG